MNLHKANKEILRRMFMEEIFEKYYDSIEKLMDESEEIKTTYDAKITEEERKLGELKTQESLMVIGSKLKEEKREERKRRAERLYCLYLKFCFSQSCLSLRILLAW